MIKTYNMINYLLYRSAARVLRSVDNPLRQKIVEHLILKGRDNVKGIVLSIGETDSHVSQHLRIMREAGIVTVTDDPEDGRISYYSLNKPVIKKLQHHCQAIIAISQL